MPSTGQQRDQQSSNHRTHQQPAAAHSNHAPTSEAGRAGRSVLTPRYSDPRASPTPAAVGVHRLVRRSCAAAGVPERLSHPPDRPICENFLPKVGLDSVSAYTLQSLAGLRIGPAAAHRTGGPEALKDAVGEAIVALDEGIVNLRALV